MGSSEPTRPQIYDCFLFNDELMLLEFRLRLLEEVVDRFVLVEADTTFQGHPKPFVFLENRDRFRRWEGKVTHVPVSARPELDNAWYREDHQRQAIRNGLDGARPTDIVLVSDVDEVPSPDTIRQLRLRPPDDYATLEMEWLNFCVDLRGPRPWYRARACQMQTLDDPGFLRDKPPANLLKQAGWHLSWLQPEKSAVDKLESYSHTEFNREYLKSEHHIRRCRDLGVEISGGFVLRPVPRSDLSQPIKDLAEAVPELIHGPRGRWSTALAHCYKLSIWGSKFLPYRMMDRYPVLAFFAAASLRAVTYPGSLARRAWWRIRGVRPSSLG